MNDNGYDRLQLLETSDKNIDLVYDKGKREIIGAWRNNIYFDTVNFDSELKELAQVKLHAIKFEEDNKIE